MQPGISIIIPTLNGLELLRKCLPPLLDEVHAYSGDSEIIIVDDGSTDGTAAILAGLFPAVRIVRSELNRGFACSMNTGIQQARLELVLMLNNDIEIARPLLAPLAECFDDPLLFAIQPRMISGSADESPDVIGSFIPRPGFLKYAYRTPKEKPIAPVETGFVSGGCALFDGKKFMALGMFDELFSPVYFEDMDLCRRAGYFGWRMTYHPGVTVYHRHPATTVSARFSKWRRNLIHKRNYFRFLLKHAPFFQNPLLAAIRLPLYACVKSISGNPGFIAGFVLALKDLVTAPRKDHAHNNRIMYLDTPIPPPGGGQKSLMVILRNLNGFQPFIVCGNPSELDTFAKDTGTPILIHRISKTRILSSLLKCRALIRLIDPALIHCNSAATFYTFLFAVAARLLRMPFIWHVRVIGSAGWKEQVIARLCTRVIVISDAVGAKFPGYGTATKIIRIYNAVDTTIFSPQSNTTAIRSSAGIAPYETVVGVFSRLDLWKGHDLFFDAVAILLARAPGTRYRFLVVGDGPDKEQIITSCKNRNLDHLTVFTGLREDIPALMNACDIVVNPSTQPEPFGRTVIEAMACARVVIATDMGGHREIIHHEKDGFLVAPDPQVMALAINSAMHDSDLRKRIGAQARETVRANFSMERQMEQIERLYSGVQRINIPSRTL